MLFVYVTVHLITKPSDIFYLMQWHAYILSVHIWYTWESNIRKTHSCLRQAGLCSRLCACSRSICLFHSHTYLFIPPSVRYLCVSFYPSSTNKRSRPFLKVSPHISSPQLKTWLQSHTNKHSLLHSHSRICVCFTRNAAKKPGALCWWHKQLCMKTNVALLMRSDL